MAEEKKIVCPIRRDYLKRWSEQIPADLWGKLELHIKECAPLKVAQKKEESP